ncbi:MAG: hypothetical protein KBI40_06390 [Firmicutes bacterium]|jgi:hypothetical protein|nr:hypothetical protein [Candidatus Fermentithermobacillaceae bacterium]
MKWLKTDLPKWLTTIAGAVVLLDKFLDVPFLKGLSTWFLNWSVFLAAFAMVLGSGNLLRVSLNKIRFKRDAWQYSYVLIAALVGYILIGVFMGPKHPIYTFVYDAAYVPIQATIFSLNAFWLATGCYRAFNVRNPQAFVLLSAGVLVMLGKVGVGYAIWSGFPGIADWIMNVPTSAVMRSLSMSAALGMIGVGLRVIAGLERGYKGGSGS